MTIKQLIRMLRCFDEDHIVEMQIDTECGCVQVGSNIEDVEFKKGNVVLTGVDY